MSKFQAVLDAASTRTPDKETAIPKQSRRKLGKRKDPDYEQVTIYIRRDTHLEAKKRLLGSEIDFSDLAQQLLNEWVASNKHTKT